MMFGDVPEHIRKRHEKDVPSLGSLDDIVLPTTSVTYEIIEPEKGARVAVLDNSAVLDNITGEALQRLKERVTGEWTGDPKEDSITMEAVRLTLTTQLRVDDSRLKKRSNDTLAALLERMSIEDERLMKIIS